MTSRCKIKFFYVDGTSSESSDKKSGRQFMGRQNLHQSKYFKLVNKVEVWLKQSYNSGLYQAFERNTLVYGDVPYESYYLTLQIPQYSEQNATHFRVKVDADREGDDDVWFELVNEDNSSKTYTNADFDQLLPIVSPIIQPTRLRIHMKPATSGATVGGTAISAVYWGTNDPKSLWTGTKRILKDRDYDEDLEQLKYRFAILPNTTGHIFQELAQLVSGLSPTLNPFYNPFTDTDHEKYKTRRAHRNSQPSPPRSLGPSQARELANYAIGVEVIGGLAGPSASASFSNFGVNEPITGLSLKDLPDVRNFAGFVGGVVPLIRIRTGCPIIRRLPWGRTRACPTPMGTGSPIRRRSIWAPIPWSRIPTGISTPTMPNFSSRPIPRTHPTAPTHCRSTMRTSP